MSFSRALALRSCFRAAARPTAARPQLWRQVARRGYASGGHESAKAGGDAVWAAGAIAVTVPSCWYLLQSKPDTAHGHGEHSDDHSKSQGGKEEEKSEDVGDGSKSRAKEAGKESEESENSSTEDEAKEADTPDTSDNESESEKGTKQEESAPKSKDGEEAKEKPAAPKPAGGKDSAAEKQEGDSTNKPDNSKKGDVPETPKSKAK